MGFENESKVVSSTFTSRMMEVSFNASSSFHSYTDVRDAVGSGDDEDDDLDDDLDDDDDDPEGGPHDTGQHDTGE